MAKGLKIKVRTFLGLIPAFAEVTEENLAGGRGGFLATPHLNRAKELTNKAISIVYRKTNNLEVSCFFLLFFKTILCKQRFTFNHMTKVIRRRLIWTYLHKFVEMISRVP